MAGYSATPLSRKLGIKVRSRVRVVPAPDNYRDSLQPLAEGVKISGRLTRNIDIWHVFITSRNALRQKLQAMIHIPDNGIIWVSWPEKASAVMTDVTEDQIRETALPPGLVDIKVCAIDDVWSGLKLGIRRSHRK